MRKPNSEPDITAVGTIVEDELGKILVLIRSNDIDNDKEPNTLGLPAGMFRPSKTFIQNAIMKLNLEVGIKASEKDLVDCGYYEFTPSDKLVRFYVYKLKIVGEHPKIIFSDVGHDSFLWEYPHILYERKDLMVGMYPILKGVYNL